MSIVEGLRAAFVWLFSTGPREDVPVNPLDKLHRSMRLTAKCRYAAAIRLENRGRFHFITTTILSLGLIFIPLMQNTGIPLAFKAEVLNMMQVFLAVAVLVYSVIIGTARYDLRAANHSECGDRIKDLIRGIDADRASNLAAASANMARYNERYSYIVTDTENHNRSDYKLAVLETRGEFFITGLPRLMKYLSAYGSRIAAYVIPTLLIGAEVVFICDMLKLTRIMTPYLSGVSSAS